MVITVLAGDVETDGGGGTPWKRDGAVLTGWCSSSWALEWLGRGIDGCGGVDWLLPLPSSCGRWLWWPAGMNGHCC